MTDCDRALELISAGLDGALTPEEKDWLEKHLEHCPACRALDADLASLHQLLPTLAPEPPAELKERIMDAVRAEKTVPFPAREQKKPRRWKAWVSVAAVAALVFLGGRAALPALNSGGPRRRRPPSRRPLPRRFPPRKRPRRRPLPHRLLLRSSPPGEPLPQRRPLPGRAAKPAAEPAVRSGRRSPAAPPSRRRIRPAERRRSPP